MNKDFSLKLIKDITSACGVSGFETEVREVIQSYMTGFGYEESTDNADNLIYTHRGKENGKTICFAAHMDEVGFMVTDILDTGYLRFIQVGGWSTLTLPSSPVEVVTKCGKKHFGLIGQISPHFLKKGAPLQVPQTEELFIDVGAKNREDAITNFGISIGDFIVPYAPFSYIEKSGKVFAKGFDDRIGCAVLIEVARMLKDCDNTIIFAFTTQEEVGERGSRILATYIKPDYSIIVEGAPADDMPSGPAHPMTEQGKGAHIRIFDPTHIGDRVLLEKLRTIAKEKAIVTQEAIRTGGGTDAVTLFASEGGSRAIVTGVPTRFAHSHISSIDLFDYKEEVKLLFNACFII